MPSPRRAGNRKCAADFSGASRLTNAVAPSGMVKK